MDLYGAIPVKGVVSCISLFDRACDISSSRPDFARALRGAAVKGGRRPSRSDLPLTAASTAANSLIRDDTGAVSPLFRSITATIPRGARHRARVARHELVFGRPKGRYHDAVMRIGGEAPRRRAHSKPRREGHSPISGCRCLGPSSAAERQCDARLQQTQWRLRRRAKLQTRRRLARGREPPQHDEQFASERNDHRLACAAAAI